MIYPFSLSKGNRRIAPLLIGALPKRSLPKPCQAAFLSALSLLAAMIEALAVMMPKNIQHFSVVAFLAFTFESR